MLNYKFGIVTDTEEDDGTVIEPKYVSGIHVESVFSSNIDIANKFCEKYELDYGYDNYNDFLKSIDIVYIKVSLEKRYEYIKEALKAKKHVISAFPYSLDIKENQDLVKLAEENDVILYNNIVTLYLQAFSQLVWNARGNLIGDLISVKCSISRKEFEEHEKRDFMDIVMYPVCVIQKLLGTDYDNVNFKLITDGNDEIDYSMLVFSYPHSVAIAEIGNSISIEGKMEIVGTEGTILVPNDWWRIGYFKVKRKDEKSYRRYTFNFQGNGLRYLIQDLLIRLRNGRNHSYRLGEDEVRKSVQLAADMRNEMKGVQNK